MHPASRSRFLTICVTLWSDSLPPMRSNRSMLLDRYPETISLSSSQREGLARLRGRLARRGEKGADLGRGQVGQMHLLVRPRHDAQAL
jgi:hypothetical protein